MIDTSKDIIGRKVVYVPDHAHGDMGHKDCEEGIVTSFNEKYVFVRYGADVNSKATLRKNLFLIGGLGK